MNIDSSSNPHRGFDLKAPGVENGALFSIRLPEIIADCEH
jgi:hypothetical protein